MEMDEYRDLFELLLSRQALAMESLLVREDVELRSWKTEARATVYRHLAFEPPHVPLKSQTHSTKDVEGLLLQEVSYEMPYGPPTHAFFLKPKGAKERLPAVLALHCHGLYKYHGKEKITWVGQDDPTLTDYKRQYYAGRSWANELAKRGYAVLVPDTFLFGSRKVSFETLLRSRVASEGEPQPESFSIERYNSLAADYEHVAAKMFFAAGTTWTGIFAYEDRRSLEYLLSRPEVDPARIGCAGLSGGGLRTVFLAGLDDRIRCAVCVGFMTTAKGLLKGYCKSHTWMAYVPGLSRYLDYPDVLALRVPLPLMVQFDEEDQLFDSESQHQAHKKISEIYRKVGASEAYKGRFYPGPHKFDLEMQGDCFEWFDRWLKRTGQH